MFGWLVRFTLFRLLPRKIIPIITLIEIARLAWGLRRRYAVKEPRRSRTAPPPWSDEPASEPPPRP